jgi:hypothetical protein
MPAINGAYVNEAAHEDAQNGMRVEGVDCVNPGTMLFRFVQRADVKDEDYVASPWWFQLSTVRKVLEAARAGHRDSERVSDQATRMAALSSTWDRSGANYLLAAKVSAPLAFFWGPPCSVGKTSGNQKKASGLKSGSSIAELEVVPDPRCVQFYVPGMSDKALARKALRVASRTKFKHSIDLANGDIDVFLARLT